MKRIEIQAIAILFALAGCADDMTDGSGLETGLDEAELQCLIGEWNPTCAYPISGDTWITHVSRDCDVIAPGLERNPMPGLDGWLVQEPVPSIEFHPVASWPEDGFYCAGGSAIDLGSLESPRCGRACSTCVERCEAQYNGIRVMITPGCLLGAHAMTADDLPDCPTSRG